MPKSTPSYVAIIGAGLGGISVALSLALEGCRGSGYEKNDTINGRTMVFPRGQNVACMIVDRDMGGGV